jgi:hypothetical protein
LAFAVAFVVVFAAAFVVALVFLVVILSEAKNLLLFCLCSGLVKGTASAVP